MNNYVKNIIYTMSGLSNVELTQRHFEVLEYVFDFYSRNKYAPLYHNIKHNTKATSEDIEKLFPHGLHSIYTWLGINVGLSVGLCKQIPAIDVENRREVYLDHNATTYLSREVLQVLNQFYRDPSNYGNASSGTEIGRRAYDIIYSARIRIADLLGVNHKEILFTSGGSESNNTAIKGIAFNHLENKGHIITNSTEHHSVLTTIKYLEKLGFDVTYLEVTPDGIVEPDAVKKAIRKDTILVSVMAVNNEIGVINPIAEIGSICAQAGVPFMVDAVQAFGKIPIKPKEMNINLMSISGHKIYAPKGIGILYVSEGLSLTPLVHGGGQENELRAGTENTPYIKAFACAVEYALADMEKENNRLLLLRDYFLKKILEVEPGSILLGSLNNRVTNNLNIGFLGVNSLSLLLGLNNIGVYVSAGSACSSGSPEPSHVIKALGIDTNRYGNIRFSMGLRTQIEDIDYVIDYLPAVIKKIREH